MPVFKYKVRRRDGHEHEGEMEAASRFELARNLRAEGNLILHVEELKKGSGGNVLTKIVSTLNRIKLKEKIVFANNLSTMISAGLTLSRSLTVIDRQSKNPKLKTVVNGLLADVNKGVTFGDALAKYPNIFPPIFVAMVKSGEESGDLPESLKLIAEQLEKSYDLRRKIKSAMIYPAIILTVIVIIGVLMMIYLVPTLSATFKDLGAELPASTRFIIGVSEFLTNYIFVVLIGLFLLLVLFWRALKTKKGKRALAFFLLHFPLTKTIAIEANSALTMRTLSSLITSGIGLVKALDITQEVVQNPYYSEVLVQAGKKVQKGATLSSILTEEEKLYPPLVSEMIQVGEETGKLGEMLIKGAEFYEEEVDTLTKNLSTVVEPVLMVIIGAAVGFFAVSMIQPMYSLGDFL